MTTEADEGIRLVTYNLRHAAPVGGCPSIGRAATICAALRPDVLALQEVDMASPRSFFADQPARVARTTGLEVRFAPNWGRPGWGSFGNALLVRGRFSDIEAVDLPGAGSARRRRALIGRVVVRSRFELTVAATHLDERRGGDIPPAVAQLDAILAALADLPRPQVLMGDLNLSPQQVGGRLRSAGFSWMEAPPTFPAADPERRIDWVAVAGLDLLDATVPDVRGSDHRPLVVTAAAPGSRVG